MVGISVCLTSEVIVIKKHVKKLAEKSQKNIVPIWGNITRMAFRITIHALKNILC